MTIGLRGDVQPFVALALGLTESGHDVTLAAPEPFEDSIAQRGLSFAPLHAKHLDLLDTDEGRKLLSGPPLRIRRNVRSVILPMIRQVLDSSWEAAQGAEAIVYHPKILAGYHLAEALRVPGFLATPVPSFSPTRAFPHPLFPGLYLGGLANRLSYQVMRLVRLPYHGTVNAWREEVLGLPRRGRWANDLMRGAGPVPVLYAFSPSVIAPAPDWPLSTFTTGYWFLEGEEGWEPSGDLLAFLAGGEPPVYVGFGSTEVEDPARLTRVVLTALEATGKRGILASGSGALRLRDLPDSVFGVRHVPHEWLFGKVEAAVHHGGAGTVAAALRAGVPSVVCPFQSEQPFWGKVLAQIGAGPPPIPIAGMSVGRLAEAIGLATGRNAIRRRASDLGKCISMEDGVGVAVEVIERVASVPAG